MLILYLEVDIEEVLYNNMRLLNLRSPSLASDTRRSSLPIFLIYLLSSFWISLRAHLFVNMKYRLASLLSLAALSGVQSHAVMQTPAPRNVLHFNHPTPL